jgi:hypothetical protein
MVMNLEKIKKWITFINIVSGVILDVLGKWEGVKKADEVKKDFIGKD